MKNRGEFVVNSTGPYFDSQQLEARGWTQSLVKKFLGEPDWWEKVNHWANFSGKALYKIDRVILAECSESFSKAYAASIKRRKLTPERLALIAESRRQYSLIDRESC
jgi:hypothetical protein